MKFYIRFSTQDISYSVLFAALTAVGSLVTIPLPLIPITLQTFFVYLSGVILGSKRGAFSQILYVLIGIIGVPVFSGFKSGISTFFGPTGGYLIGFIVGSYIIGKIIEYLRFNGFKSKKHYQFSVVVSLIVGTLIIYLFGVLQLSFILGGFQTFDISNAVKFGVIPFLLGDAIKIICVSLIILNKNIILLTQRINKIYVIKNN
jgi:biotin transport system substrate-specific component